MKRPDAWHDAYRAIYSTTGCIRLTVAQAAAQMGTSPKRVTQQYPYGWSGQGRGQDHPAGHPAGSGIQALLRRNHK